MSEQTTVQFPQEITVSVTEKHIREGEQLNCGGCPISLAIKDVIPDAAPLTGVDGIIITLWGGKTHQRVEYHIPREARSFVVNFDDEESVQPFTFTARRTL